MYVVIASNANHVRLIGPGAETLHARGEDVRVLTTDAWYGQGAAVAARGLSCPSEELPAPPGRGTEDWFSTAWDRRLVATEAAAPIIRSTVEDLAPRAIVLGNDTGLLEQLVISSARDLGIPTIVMQDADFVASQAASRPTGQLLLGEGGCDSVLAWGRRGVEYYVALGLSVPIHEVGSPKVGALPTSAQEGALRTALDLSNASAVVVPLQCCARYGMLSEQDERTHMLDIVDALGSSGNHHVLVTPHPSHSAVETGWYRAAFAARDLVTFVEDRPSVELLPVADAVIGIDSAFLLDSVALGVPAIAATFGVPWAKTDYEGAIPVFDDRDAFRRYVEDRKWPVAVREAFEERRHRFERRLLAARATESAHRIADAVLAVADDAMTAPTEAVPVTSLLRVTDVTVAGLSTTLKGIRAQHGVTRDIRVIDATSDGLSLGDDVTVFRDRDPAIGRAFERATSELDGLVALWAPGISALPHRLLSAHRALAANPQVDAITADALCHLPCGPTLARTLVEPDGSSLPPGWLAGTVVRADALRRIAATAFWPTDRVLIDTLIEEGRWMRTPEAVVLIDDETSRALRPAARWEDGASERAPAADGVGVDLSVIICTFNRADVTLTCLESFARQTAPTDSYEIILVDDSTDSTLHDLVGDVRWPVRTRVIRRERGSLASARNAAIEQANGTWLLFVNDDTIAFPECVQEHVRAHRMAPDRVSVLGTFEQPPAALEGALMRHLEQSSEVFCYGLMRPGERYDWTRYWTCNVSSPADAIREVGGFDESFENYGCEDTDLGYRLGGIGLPVLYHGAARAHHHHILSFDDLARRQRTVARAWVRLLQKHPVMLEHPDWAWVQDVSVTSARQRLTASSHAILAWQRAGASLAQSDIGALAAIGSAGAEVIRHQLATLAELVRRLNELWWQEGFIEGLEEHGLAAFSTLLDTIPGPLDHSRKPHVLLEITDEITSAHLPSLRAAIKRARGGTLGVPMDPAALTGSHAHFVAAANGAPLPSIVPITPPANQAARRRLLRKMDAFIPDVLIAGQSHLLDARIAGVEIVDSPRAHLLASRAPLRILAHPDWREPSALETLLTTFGPELKDREDICLALLLDPAEDPPLEDILPAFAQAHATTMGPATLLNALVIDDVTGNDSLDALLASVHAVLMPTSDAVPAGVRVCRTRDELRELLTTLNELTRVG